MKPQKIKSVYAKWTCESNNCINKDPCTCKPGYFSACLNNCKNQDYSPKCKCEPYDIQIKRNID